MQFPEVILGLVFAAFAIPLVIAALRVWVKRLWAWSSRPRGQSRRAQEPPPAVDLLEAEVESLRERMAAVEAIVTDDGYRLTRELDRIDVPETARRTSPTA